jgi:hypothetical protein
MGMRVRALARLTCASYQGQGVMWKR